MQKTKKNIYSNYYFFIMLFLILFMYSMIVDVTDYTHDYLSYWTKGDVIWTYGSGKLFTFTEFPETFRGYFAYFFIMLFKHGFAIVFKNAYWGWRFISATSVAGALSFALPYIFDLNIESKLEWFVRYGILICILLYICGDYLQKPASDWLSAFFFIVAVALIKYICQTDNKIKLVVASFLAGMLLYAAYNTRVAYLYATLIALVVAAVVFIKKKPAKLLLFAAILVGAVLVAFPQMQINHKYTGKWSPKVNTDQLYNYEVDLQRTQLFWGIYQPRYETYDGSIEEYPEQGVFFCDKTGQEILEREGLAREDMGAKRMLMLFAKYPGDMIAIYTRHMASITVPTRYESCINNLYTSKLFRVTLSIWMWIVAFVAFTENYHFNKLKLVDYILACGMILPSLMQCAGAIEVRFFIMCFVLLYFYICCMIDYKALWKKIEGRRIKLLIASMLVYFVWMALLGDILAMNRETVFLINDYLK